MTTELESAPAKSSGESSTGYSSRFAVGGVSVQLAGEQAVDVALLASLEPFRVETGVSDINIRVERVACLSRAFGQPLFHSGATWELHTGECGFQFDFNAAMFGNRPFKRMLIDSRFQHATLQMNKECLAQYPQAVEPLGYPLDELLIMHRLTQEKAIELHGCGIVRVDGTGNLFVGHSGAGKSTTTRLWTELEAVHVLSDDRIIVRRDEDAVVETPLQADGHAGKHEVLRKSGNQPKMGCGMRMYGTPWHGEAMYASPGSAPLLRIFILEHGRGNVLTRLSPSLAVAELFARSFVPFHRHEYVDSALEFLQELAGAVPVYHYAFEPNAAAVERILAFRD